MLAVNRVAARRGVSLAECLVALVVASVVLAAVWALLLAGWRISRAAAAATATREGVRATATILYGELSGTSAATGDLIAISDSALVLRATRGLGVLCADPVGSSVVLSDSLFSATRTVDPSRDSALLFREGDPSRSDDDRWLRAGISSTRADLCPDGGAGTRLTLTGASAAELSGVTGGAPLRTFEILEYRRYTDGSGLAWLGVRGPAAGGGWAATSPLAGPLRPGDGVVFRFVDRAGRATTDPASVVIVEAAVHGLDPRPLAPMGHSLGPTADSTVVRVQVGGP